MVPISTASGRVRGSLEQVAVGDTLATARGNYSEVQLQRELNDPRIHCGGRNYAKGGRGRYIGAGVAELGRVEGVEKLRVEFQVGAFAQPAERRPLNDRDVEVPLVRPEDDANAAVTETRGAPVIADHQPGSGIGC